MSETTPLNEWSESDLLKLIATIERTRENVGTGYPEYIEFAERVLPAAKQALKDVLFETYHGK